jgi:hypothetical protein
MKRIEAKDLAGKELTVRDLMQVLDDIDVYDNVCESLAIAFCNPFDDDEVHDWSEYLTERGMKQFADVLDYKMEIGISTHGTNHIFADAVIDVDDENDAVWKARLSKAKRLFESAAGYCSCDDYKKWFKI